MAPTDIFLSTLRNFISKRWPIIFFTLVEVFLFGVAYKNYNVGQLCFFMRAQPKLCHGRHWHVLIYSASKTLAQLDKKKLITDIYKKKMVVDIGQER